ncbi:uncharacterized protein LY89DRAFT_690314, partial [Mollisia scopiformis]
MDSTLNDIPVSLRSWPSIANDSNALPTLIQRINIERGGFLNITEESLRQEIADEELNGQDEEDSSSSDEEDEPDKLKALMAAREELLKEIEQAHQSSLFALDFISLLLTKDAPIQAMYTMSPYLQEMIPPKTLGADKLAATKLTEAQKADNKQIAKGWKAQSLDNAVDSILASATRLEKEIEHETKYWEQVLAVSDNGWAVCRLPNEKHTLGVRYGFSEASPAFKNRSLAVLRRNADGSISLDQGIAETEPKTLRVRIQVDGEYTGISTIPKAVPEDAPIESLILQARNTVFAEELWQELNREARSLAPIQAKDDTLIYQLSKTKTIVLDLVSLNESRITSTNDTDKSIAEGLYLALNLLLSYSHRQNYRRRTQPRKPISPQKEPPPPILLLRGVLTRLAYQESITALHSLLGPLCSVLKDASITPPSSYTLIPNVGKPPSILTNAEKTIMSLISQLEAKVTLSITANTTINITLNTYLNPTNSLFHVSLANPDDPLHLTCPPYTPYSSFEALRDYIFQATACALASTLIPSLIPVSNVHSPPANGTTKQKEEKDWVQTAQPSLLTNPNTQKQLSISVRAREANRGSIYFGKSGISLDV